MITSVSNEKIKYIKKLKNNKFMNEEKKFIVETPHLVEEAMKSGLLIETISLEDVNYKVPNTIVSSNVMKTISNLKSVPSVIGICNMISDNDKLGNKIIILDGVQDPGNLGTIIRSANAFGFTDIILSIDCCNKYNDKVLRATEGMVFNTNIITRDLISFIHLLKSLGYLVYGTNVVNGTNVKDVSNNNPLAIILGSEGKGVSKEVSNLVDKNIYINMNKTCESLNVAVAASILMYELGNK